MNSKWFFNEAGDNNQIITDYVREHHPKTIVICTETEWFWKLEQEDVNRWYNDGVENIKIIYGSEHCEYYDKLYQFLNIPIENITFWKTLWINWGELCLRNNFDYKKLHDNLVFDHSFICLNNKSHFHRCCLVDNIIGAGIADKGVLTLNNFNNNKTPEKNTWFPWKHHDGSFIALNDQFFEKQDSFVICEEVNNSFLHIIGEATTTVPFLTEKTLKPLMFKRPFVVLGHQKFNKLLKDLGFELYEEIIDYSYDEIDDEYLRAQSIIDNVKSMCQTQNLNSLYDKLKPKLDYNYNRAIDIINDKSYIPESLAERWKVTNPEELRGTDLRSEVFLTQQLSK